MGMALSLFQMGAITRAHIETIKRMDEEYTSGQMGEDMRENSTKGSNME